MEFSYNKYFLLFAIIIIGSQLVYVCSESSALKTDTNSIDVSKRYRLDKKDVTTDIDNNDSEAHDEENGDQLLEMNKRYRFDKRYRLDKKQVNSDQIDKRYRLGKRYRFD